jgi:hypothetical protein
VPEEVRKTLTFHTVSTLEEALKIALVEEKDQEAVREKKEKAIAVA